MHTVWQYSMGQMITEALKHVQINTKKWSKNKKDGKKDKKGNEAESKNFDDRVGK